MIYTSTLHKDTKKLLDSIIIEDKFYLAGGTALALQIGHRQSVDLDFFSEIPFNPNSILMDLQDSYDVKNIQIFGDHTIYIECNNVKVSFMLYKYPNIAEYVKYNANINLSSIDDILCMKLSAISQRNTKKDFIDIYYILKKQKYSLKDAIQLANKKFKNLNMVHILYSLTYFDEADTDPDIIWQEGFEISWNEIKDYFVKIVQESSEDESLLS